MHDVTADFRYQRVPIHAALWKTLSAILETDPDVGPGTVKLIKRFYKTHRDDDAYAYAIREEATRA